MTRRKAEAKPHYLLIPEQVASDPKCNGLDFKLYGYIFWLEGADKVKARCFASNAHLARLCNSSPQSVANSLNNLEKLGHIERVFEDIDKTKRLEIKTLYRFGKVGGVNPEVKGGTPVGLGGVHPQVNINNNSINSNKETVSDQNEPYPVKAYLDLYCDLLRNKQGVAVKLTEYVVKASMVKRILKDFSPEQVRAMMFCHFEWRGWNGEDDGALRWLVNNGFPLAYFSKNAPNYAVYLERTLGKLWGNEKELKEVVDAWVESLREKLK